MYSFYQLSEYTYTTIAVMMCLIYASNVSLTIPRDKITHYYMRMLQADICMLVFNALSYRFLRNDTQWFLQDLFRGLGDFAYFFVLAFFTYYITAFISSRTEVSVWYARVALLVALVYGTGWFVLDFTDLLYVVDGKDLLPGKYYIPAQMGGYVILAICIYLIIRYKKDVGIRNTMAFLFFCSLPLIGIVVRYIRFHIPPTMPTLISFTLVLIQGFSQVEHHREQRLRLERARMAVMMSQIRPHFIYNVLNSIYALCDISTEKTKETVASFSEYLRTNLSMEQCERMIPFSREIRHIENYLNLEKLRFGDRLKTEIHVGDDEFLLPVLSIQPIVENAVRHGVTKREEGGTVKMSCERQKEGHLILIEDDGVGFDTDILNKKEDDGKVHIGLENAKSRIEMMCGGKVGIHSEIGKGTRVEIWIPESIKTGILIS